MSSKQPFASIPVNDTKRIACSRENCSPKGSPVLVAVLPCWWDLLTAGLAVVACALCFCCRGLRVAELPGCVVEDVKRGAVIKEDVPAEHNGQTDYVSAAGKTFSANDTVRRIEARNSVFCHHEHTFVLECSRLAGHTGDAASPAEPAESNDCCVISSDPCCEQ